MSDSGSHSVGACRISRSTQWRIFLTCWLVYLVHFSPFVTREQYLTMAIAERGTFRVPEYIGMHPDLFTLPGRGDFVGTNPGISFAAAIPYWLSLPVVTRVAPIRPLPPEEIEAAQYKEERRNRQRFFRLARERGIDVRLGVAALITSGFFMAPLTALSAVLLYRILRRLEWGDSFALWMTLLYAFGTPAFLRTGTLSLNLFVGLLGLAAFVLIWWPSAKNPQREWLRYFIAGALGGYAVATDFTGVITLLAIGVYALIQQLEKKKFFPALRGTLWTVAGAIPPGLFLLWYQWHCYGDPFKPVHFHMPRWVFQGYASDRGIGWPVPEVLNLLLFHAQYGVLIFAPLFALALYHPVLIWKKLNRVPARFALASWIYFVMLWLFCSGIQYTTRHQWQDGVRYMVPALLPLFFLVADVFAHLRRWLALPIIGYSIFLSWCLAMVRSNPYDSMAKVLSEGVQYPWLTTLSNAAMQYFPPLADPASTWSRSLPWMALGSLVVGLAVIWAVRGRTGEAGIE